MPAFTTIATAIGLGATAASAVGSFSQASKQNELQKQAEAEAAKAMQDARKRLEVNYYKGLSIAKEPYELARESLLAQGVQTLEAAKEGESRGVGAVAGRLQMAQNQAERQISSDMSTQMMELEKLKAQEDARLAMANANLSLSQVEGAQTAAANAAEMSAKATQQGFAGLTSLAGGLAGLAPLYAKDNAKLLSQSKDALAGLQLTPQEFAVLGNVKSGTAMGNEASPGFTNIDLSKIPQMSTIEYNQFVNTLDPKQRQMLVNKINPFLIK